jgi:hypothetical protein
LRALNANPGGLRFKDVKHLTGLHQDTLAIRLRELVDMKLLQQDGRRYRINKDGTENLHKRQLISQINASSSLVVVGGPEAGSIHPGDDTILKSSMGFAFPAAPVDMVGHLSGVVHKYWMLHQLVTMARKHLIDPRCITGEAPIEKLVESLRQNLTRSSQVLAFMIDQEQLRSLLNPEYVREILRIAKVEDESHIETADSQFMNRFRRYGMEYAAIQFLEKNQKSPLQAIAEHLKIPSNEAEQLLDRLEEAAPREMQQRRGGITVTVRIMKRSRVRKTKEHGTVYYALKTST